MDYLTEYKKWCESDEFDNKTKEELIAIKMMTKKLKIDFIKSWNLEQQDLGG